MELNHRNILSTNRMRKYFFRLIKKLILTKYQAKFNVNQNAFSVSSLSKTTINDKPKIGVKDQAHSKNRKIQTFTNIYSLITEIKCFYVRHCTNLNAALTKNT